MNKKSLTKNYIYNLIYQMLIIILPLITTPYVSRVLGAENIGVYSYTLSITTYFILVGTLGIAIYGQREIAYVQNDKNKRSIVFWEIIILRIITTSLSVILFYFTMISHTEYKLYYIIFLLQFLAEILDLSFFFQGIEEFKKTVTRNMLVKIGSIILIFLIIKSKGDLWKYILIYVLSNVIGNIGLWMQLPKYIERIKVSSLKILRHIRPIIVLFIPQVALQIYTVLDRSMLGTILNEMSEVGYYEQAQKIIKMPINVVTAMGTVIAPRIAIAVAQNNSQKIKEYIKKSFDFAWFIGIPVMFGIAAIANNMVPWFLGEEYIKSASIIIVGAPIIILIALNNITGMQYLVQKKEQKKYTKSIIIGAVINVIMNLILIRVLKSIGAMIASVVAELIVLVVQIIYIYKEIPIKTIFKSAYKYLISGIIMFVIVYVEGKVLNTTINSTCIQIFTGGVVYILMLIILKDKLLKDLFMKLKVKIEQMSKSTTK